MSDPDDKSVDLSLLSEFKVISKIVVAWGEMDAFAHVNNSVYFRYFETSRTRYLEKLGVSIYEVGPDQTQAIGPILKSISAVYKGPVHYPDTLYVGTRVVTIEEDRFDVKHAILSGKTGRIVTIGECTIVCFDYHKNTKTPIPAIWRKNMMAIEVVPPVLMG